MKTLQHNKHNVKTRNIYGPFTMALTRLMLWPTLRLLMHGQFGNFGLGVGGIEVDFLQSGPATEEA